LMLMVAVVLLVVVMLGTRDDSGPISRRFVANAPSSPPAQELGALPPARPSPEPDSSPPGPETASPTRPAAEPDAAPESTFPPAKPPGPTEPTEIQAMFGKDAVGNPPAPAPENPQPEAIIAEPEPSVAPPPGPATSPAPTSSQSDSGLPTLPPFENPADPTMKPSPEPAPTKPVSGGTEPTEEEVQQLARALTDARTALENHQYDQAISLLEKVEQLPMLPEHEEKFQRLQLLVQYARNFRTALSDAVAALQGGDEIPLGNNTAVGVVQTERDRITVRVAGANRIYPLDNLPVGLAIAIADQHLADSDPVSLVLKASYLASVKGLRDDQLAKAREWFGEARQRGVDIGDLEKVLDDSYKLTP